MNVTLQELELLLKKYPVIVQGNSLLLGCIEGIKVAANYNGFVKSLDMLENVEVGPVAITDNKAPQDRFPTVTLIDPLDTVKISHSLFYNEEVFRSLMTTQSEISNIITSYAEKDVVVLVIVDGLSYFDCLEHLGVNPCFVDGVTLTREGFLSIVGNPTIAQKMFDIGFFDLIGYTYWTREMDSAITDEIFCGFPSTALHKIREFEDSLKDLRQQKLLKTYVQIVLNGLDHLCHSSRDRPIYASLGGIPITFGSQISVSFCNDSANRNDNNPFRKKTNISPLL